MARRARQLRAAVLTVLVLSAVLGAGSGSATSAPVPATTAAPGFDECAELTEPDVYDVDANVTHSGSGTSSVCIRINASNVVFDGEGYTLGGQGVSNTTAIYVTDARNVTIKNIRIDSWQRGIYFENASNITVRNVTVKSNVYGLAFENTNNVTVADSNVSRNFVGVSYEGETNNTFVNTEIGPNRVGGIHGALVVDWFGFEKRYGPPTDYDGDGLYEDVTGDGNRTFGDKVALASVVTADLFGATDPSPDQVAALDFDGNGRLGYGDVLAL